jgi:glycopeptide antibiotics resistance protein
VVLATSITYLIAVIAFRLLPSPWPQDRAELPGGVLNIANWFEAKTWSRALTSDFGLNVLMFVPIGLIAGRYLRSWWLRILTPIALGFAIEAIQLPLPYRVSDPRDVAANTIGALIGIVAVWIIEAYRRDRDADPARITTRLD